MSKSRVKFSGTDFGLLMRLEWDTSFPQLLVDLTVWAFIPLVVGLTLIFGLEEAAYRNLAAPES